MKTALGKSILNEAINKINNSVTKPVVIGISGPQGSGKSTAVEYVASQLSEQFGKKVVYFSLDDVYLTHEKQQALRIESGNPLLAKRGLPGTHDVSLCNSIMKYIQEQAPCDIPVYDKSAFNGEGDRSAQAVHMEPPYDVVLFEGWCVGFEQLSEQDLEDRYTSSKAGNPRQFRFNTAYTEEEPEISNDDQIIQSTYIKNYELGQLRTVNEKLEQYETDIWSFFDLLIHIDTVDLNFVYQWRLQQEHHLIRLKGRGMTDEQVKLFVDSYMPAYELYFNKLRERQGVHFVLDKDRDLVVRNNQ